MHDLELKLGLSICVYPLLEPKVTKYLLLQGFYYELSGNSGHMYGILPASEVIS